MLHIVIRQPHQAIRKPESMFFRSLYPKKRRSLYFFRIDLFVAVVFFCVGRVVWHFFKNKYLFII